MRREEPARLRRAVLLAILLAGDQNNARLETRHGAPHPMQSDARIATFSAASHKRRIKGCVMSAQNDDDRVLDPMILDALFELETVIAGTYLSWMNEAKTDEEVEHWRQEMYRISDEVKEVDYRSRSAIEALRSKLREHYHSMGDTAPNFAL